MIVFNNKKFGDYVKEIYPSQLTVEKANTSDDLANYLELTFIIESNNRFYTKLYDKRDDVFKVIPCLNFSFAFIMYQSFPSLAIFPATPGHLTKMFASGGGRDSTRAGHLT